MLETLIANKRYSFYDKFDRWEEAIKASCEPLVKEGIADKEYADYIINNVNEHGPYIVIAPEIAIPHAQEGQGVHETAIAFMRVKEPVDFGAEAEFDARLFFVLASVNNDEHLANLSELVTLLSDDEIIQKFIDASSEEDLQAILKEVN